MGQLTMLKLKHISWAVTSQCNLHCSHCFASKELGNEISYEFAQNNIINELAHLGGKSIGFTGGEPLLRNDILYLISYAKQKDLLVSLVTNGLLLDSDMAKRLKRAGLDRLQISLDASNSEDNDAIRGNGVFDIVTKEAIPNSKKAGLHVTLAATPTKSLHHNLHLYIDLAVDLKVDAIYIRRFVKQQSHYADISCIQNNYYFLQSIYEHSVKYRNRISIHCGDPQYALVNPKYRKYKGRSDLISGCAAGLTSLSITADGSVQLCTRAPLSLGNVKSNSLKTIWTSNDLIKKVRNRLNFCGKCAKCEYLFLCGGCRATALHSSSIIGSDPYCILSI